MRWMEAMLCLASVCQSLQCSNRLRPHQPPAPRTGARSAARAPNRLSSYEDQTTTRVEFLDLRTSIIDRLNAELAIPRDIQFAPRDLARGCEHHYTGAGPAD